MNKWLMTGNRGVSFVLFLQGKEMNKDVNISNLTLSVDYHWLVPVIKRELNNTIIRTNNYKVR